MFEIDKHTLIEVTYTTLQKLDANRFEIKCGAMLEGQLAAYEVTTADLVAAIGVASYWAPADQAPVIAVCVSSILNRLRKGGWTNSARPYVALLVMYAAALTALASGRYHNLVAAFRGVVLPTVTDTEPNFRIALPIDSCLSDSHAVTAVNHATSYLPKVLDRHIFPSELDDLICDVLFLHLLALCDYRLVTIDDIRAKVKDYLVGIQDRLRSYKGRQRLGKTYNPDSDNAKRLVNAALCEGDLSRYSKAFTYASGQIYI
jgi:hypothetical protein